MSGERPPCTHRICSSINCREMTRVQNTQHSPSPDAARGTFTGHHLYSSHLDNLLVLLTLFALTAAIVSMSKTLVQYLQAFAFPYLVWHSSVGENGFIPHGSLDNRQHRQNKHREQNLHTPVCHTSPVRSPVLGPAAGQVQHQHQHQQQEGPSTSCSASARACANVAPQQKQKPHVPEKKSSKICLKHIPCHKRNDPVNK